MLPTDLIARLEALGGFATGEVSRFESYEIITPAMAPEKVYWVSASSLAALLDEWEANGVQGARWVRLFRDAERASQQKEGKE